jgi:hypothetical protein
MLLVLLTLFACALASLVAVGFLMRFSHLIGKQDSAVGDATWRVGGSHCHAAALPPFNDLMELWGYFQKAPLLLAVIRWLIVLSGIVYLRKCVRQQVRVCARVCARTQVRAPAKLREFACACVRARARAFVSAWATGGL